MTIVAGFDLGGSHAACLVADGEGRILGRGTGGPANMANLGREQVLAAIGEALSGAVRALPGGVAAVMRCVIGGAGGGSEEKGKELAVLARAAGLACPIAATHDAAIALAGALLLRPGIIVMAGTGSIAYGVDDNGHRVRAGGFGPLLGDEGSGYWIGLRGLRAALRAFDGRDEATVLTARLAESLGLSGAEGFAQYPYEPARLKPASVAALAPAVFRAAREGDPIAAGILDEAAAELALLARTVAKRLEGGVQLLLTYGGGLFRAGKALLDRLRVHLARYEPNLRLQAPAGSPLLGAVLMALAEEGIPAARVAKRLRAEMNDSFVRRRVQESEPESP